MHKQAQMSPHGFDHLRAGMAVRRTVSPIWLLLAANGCIWIPADDLKAVLDNPPEVRIQSPSEGQPLYADQAVVVHAKANDPEGGDLTWRWSSDVQGDLSLRQSEGELLLEPGEHLLRATVRDSHGKEGTAQARVFVHAANTPPRCDWVAPEPDNVSAVGEDLLLRGVIEDDEATHDLLSATFSSNRDGQLQTLTPGSDGSIQTTVRLTEGAHTLRLTGLDEVGGSCASELAVQVGSPPEVSFTHPTEGSASAEGAPVVLEAIATHPTLALDTLTATWSSDLDGEFAFTAPDLDGRLATTVDSLQPGTHQLTVHLETPSGLWASDNLTLRIDGQPQIRRVQIAPLVPATDDALSVTTETEDPEGDDLLLTYRWFRDGVEELSLISDTVPSGIVFRGEVWSVEVSASDEHSVSSVATDSVNIVNAPPEVWSFELSPDPVYTNSLATARFVAGDPEADSFSTEVSWQVNGGTPSTGTTLDGTNFAKGDRIQYQVVVDDGSESASIQSPEWVVQNSLPQTLSVEITPHAPIEGDEDVVCQVDGIDADEDSLSWTFAWTRDGVSWTGATSSTHLPGDTIAGSDTLGSSTWSCTATPDDSEDVGIGGTDAVRLRPSFNGWASFPHDVSGEIQLPGGNETAGRALALGDVDGDGALDLVVSMGAVDIYPLSDILAGSTSLTNRISQFDYGGGGVYFVDWMEDGSPNDLLITSCGNDLAQLELSVWTAGRLPDTPFDQDPEWASVRGYKPGASRGCRGSIPGDFDGDGALDLAFTRDNVDLTMTEVRLLMGTDRAIGASSLGVADGSAVQTSSDMSLAGLLESDDLDGDGLADLLMSSGTNHACIAWGGTWAMGGDLCTDGTDLQPAALGNYLGLSVATGGDADGDGLGDLLLGDPNDDSVAYGGGKVHLILGSSIDTQPALFSMNDADGSVVGTETWEQLTGPGGYGGVRSLDFVGDLEGDGTDDIAFADAGGVGLCTGSTGGISIFLGVEVAGAHLTSDEAAGRLSHPDACGRQGAVAGLGDINLDGRGDITVAWMGGSNPFYLVYGP
jgi:hypothetical protein